ncbi:MAG: hypothetical protein ACI9U2_003071 [Bradymonadia bacterium]|jgi:hypothetical protein
MRLIALFVLLSTTSIAFAAPGHDHDAKAAVDPNDPAIVLAKLVKPYLKVRQALVEDDLPEARKWAGMLMLAAKKNHQPELATAAFKFKDADLVAARLAFRGVSALVIAAMEAYPPARVSMAVYDCDKAPGRWLQIGSVPTNPYQGGALRGCGTEIPPTAAMMMAAAAAPAAPASDDHDVPDDHEHGKGKGKHTH